MENIEEKTTTNTKCNNSESKKNYIIPNDPVARYWNNSNKRNQYHISDTYSKGQGFGSKFGIGNTSVHFR